jgi:hypothetical protein
MKRLNYTADFTINIYCFASFRVTRALSSAGPTDLMLELVRIEGPITADDTQAMGLG